MIIKSRMERVLKMAVWFDSDFILSPLAAFLSEHCAWPVWLCHQTRVYKLVLSRPVGTWKLRIGKGAEWLDGVSHREYDLMSMKTCLPS